MRMKYSKKTEWMIERTIEAIREMNEDDVLLVHERLSKLAAHSASIYDGEANETRDPDLWETKTEAFEEGFELATKLRPGETVFIVTIEGEVYEYAQYWFVSTSEKELLTKIGDSMDSLKEEIRKMKGLLPFKK